MMVRIQPSTVLVAVLVLVVLGLAGLQAGVAQNGTPNHNSGAPLTGSTRSRAKLYGFTSGLSMVACALVLFVRFVGKRRGGGGRQRPDSKTFLEWATVTLIVYSLVQSALVFFGTVMALHSPKSFYGSSLCPVQARLLVFSSRGIIWHLFFLVFGATSHEIWGRLWGEGRRTQGIGVVAFFSLFYSSMWWAAGVDDVGRVRGVPWCWVDDAGGDATTLHGTYEDITLLSAAAVCLVAHAVNRRWIGARADNDDEMVGERKEDDVEESRVAAFVVLALTMVITIPVTLLIIAARSLRAAKNDDDDFAWDTWRLAGDNDEERAGNGPSITRRRPPRSLAVDRLPLLDEVVGALDLEDCTERERLTLDEAWWQEAGLFRRLDAGVYTRNWHHRRNASRSTRAESARVYLVVFVSAYILVLVLSIEQPTRSDGLSDVALFVFSWLGYLVASCFAYEISELSVAQEALINTLTTVVPEVSAWATASYYGVSNARASKLSMGDIKVAVVKAAERDFGDAMERHTEACRKYVDAKAGAAEAEAEGLRTGGGDGVPSSTAVTARRLRNKREARELLSTVDELEGRVQDRFSDLVASCRSLAVWTSGKLWDVCAETGRFSSKCMEGLKSRERLDVAADITTSAAEAVLTDLRTGAEWRKRHGSSETSVSEIPFGVNSRWNPASELAAAARPDELAADDDKARAHKVLSVLDDCPAGWDDLFCEDGARLTKLVNDLHDAGEALSKFAKQRGSTRVAEDCSKVAVLFKELGLAAEAVLDARHVFARPLPPDRSDHEWPGHGLRENLLGQDGDRRNRGQELLETVPLVAEKVDKTQAETVRKVGVGANVVAVELLKVAFRHAFGERPGAGQNGHLAVGLRGMLSEVQWQASGDKAVPRPAVPVVEEETAESTATEAQAQLDEKKALASIASSTLLAYGARVHADKARVAHFTSLVLDRWGQTAMSTDAILTNHRRRFSPDCLSRFVAAVAGVFTAGRVGRIARSFVYLLAAAGHFFSILNATFLFLRVNNTDQPGYVTTAFGPLIAYSVLVMAWVFVRPRVDEALYEAAVAADNAKSLPFSQLLPSWVYNEDLDTVGVVAAPPPPRKDLPVPPDERKRRKSKAQAEYGDDDGWEAKHDAGRGVAAGGPDAAGAGAGAKDTDAAPNDDEYDARTPQKLDAIDMELALLSERLNQQTKIEHGGGFARAFLSALLLGSLVGSIPWLVRFLPGEDDHVASVDSDDERLFLAGGTIGYTATLVLAFLLLAYASSVLQHARTGQAFLLHECQANDFASGLVGGRLTGVAADAAGEVHERTFRRVRAWQCLSARVCAMRAPLRRIKPIVFLGLTAAASGMYIASASSHSDNAVFGRKFQVVGAAMAVSFSFFVAAVMFYGAGANALLESQRTTLLELKSMFLSSLVLERSGARMKRLLPAYCSVAVERLEAAAANAADVAAFRDEEFADDYRVITGHDKEDAFSTKMRPRRRRQLVGEDSTLKAHQRRGNVQRERSRRVVRTGSRAASVSSRTAAGVPHLELPVGCCLLRRGDAEIMVNELDLVIRSVEAANQPTLQVLPLSYTGLRVYMGVVTSVLLYVFFVKDDVEAK